MPKNLGKYQLIKLIKAGTVSEVWRAVHTPTQQTYAIKVLLPQYHGDIQLVKQLRHEAAVSKLLECFAVPRVVASETEANFPFNVIEYFPSVSLRSLMTEKYRSDLLSNVQNIVSQAAKGLECLHDKGWVHTAISPAHILLNQQFSLRLIDLTQSRKHPPSKLSLLGSKTRASGNLLYMSPEQFRGQPLDPRSDIYSLGCVLYEMVEGHPPYSGANQQELMKKHIGSKVPRLTKIPRQLTAEFVELVASMMEKEPIRRPECALHVLHRLQKCTRDEENVVPRHFEQTVDTRSETMSEVAVTASRVEIESRTTSKPNPIPKPKPGTWFKLRGLLTRLACMRRVQVSFVSLVAITAMVWFYPSSDDAEYEILRRTTELLSEVRNPPQSAPSDELVEFWRSIHKETNANKKEADQALLPPSSSRPDRLELSWAVNKLQNVTSKTNETIDVEKLVTVERHLTSAKKHLDSRKSRREALFAIFKSDTFFWVILAVDAVGLAYVVQTIKKPR